MENLEELKPYRAVRISVDPGEPWIRPADVDAELLVQLAGDRRGGRLARLDLSAGEFSVSGVQLARRTARHEERAVGAQDDGSGHIDHCAVTSTSSRACPPSL